MKYNILVTAQTGDSDLVLFSEARNVCRFTPRKTFLQWLEENFPLLKWEFDDGEDFDDDEDTTYCQYVFYPGNKDASQYVLANFQATKD